MGVDWTKFGVGIATGLIVALQGINLTQGAAMLGTEKRVETLEEDLVRQNLELSKKITANQEEFRTRLEKMEEILLKLSQK